MTDDEPFTYEELDAITEPQEALHDNSVMPWGKHKGELLGDIPDAYWLWFLDQPWCDDWPLLVEYANHCDPYED